MNTEYKTKNRINSTLSPVHLFIRSSLNSEKGLVLITALFMLVALIGVVLICVYPLAHEEKNTVRHHITLERYKEMERGAFGRLGNQKGGKFNACGGYFSDGGFKVKAFQEGEVKKMLEYWCFKKLVSRCRDIYRYDKDFGFWAGYRGKRYIIRPPGEEHMRGKGFVHTTGQIPIVGWRFPIFIDGYKSRIDYCGYVHALFHFSAPGATTVKSHPERHYNPVENLVINVNDHRMTGPLSATLIYADQLDFDLAPEVVGESGIPENGDFDYTFIFDWEDWAVGGSGSVCPGATYQIGLKKLIIYEDGIPRFTQAICVPPAKKFRNTERNPGVSKDYNNLYSVEIDYE